MTTEKLTDYEATMIVEGVEEVEPNEYYAAVQHLINTGLAWKLQGYFGRVAMECLRNGLCYDPLTRRRKAANALQARLDSATPE